MKVIIVDDEPAARRTLRECCALEPDLELVGEYGDGRVALERIHADPPDLLFLDIQMDALDGIALARAIDHRLMPMIVFVTAYDHYALEAFEVAAIDYLLKPFDEERFRKTVARVRERRVWQVPNERQAAVGALLSQLEAHIRAARPETKTRVMAECNGTMHLLDADRIELVEADRNYVVLRVGRDVYYARSTLQQAEQVLGLQPLLRISRSCLINLSHLREVSRTPRGDFILVLAGGATVTSSEGYREKVRAQIEALKLRPPAH
jgi:two-component system, LytTR family, response regulator